MIFAPLYDLFIPNKCAACLSDFGDDGAAGVCNVCASKLEFFGGGLCFACSRPSRTELCARCAEYGARSLDRVFALGWYGGALGSLIRGSKIWNIYDPVEMLADRLAARILPVYDMVAPVPSEHEFAARFAEALGERLSVDETAPGLVRRKPGAHTQVGLSRAERIENAKVSFELSEARPGVNILLVDDISTTGASIASIAALLKEAGADYVSAAVAALAPDE